MECGFIARSRRGGGVREFQSLAYVVRPNGWIDRRASFFSERLTLGGRGWVNRNSVVVRRDRGAIEQFIALEGHANDGATGEPLLPTMEMPF